jgi:hypothetical protein
VTAAARKPLVGEPVILAAEEIRADPVEVFRLRCGSRAKLWHTGQIDLHSAVDELQHSAEASGLVAAIGQDAVQGLMVEAFAPLRDDLPRAENSAPEDKSASQFNGGGAGNPAPVDDDPWSAPGWRDAAIDYHEARNGRTSVVSYSADELERLRRLMADDISIERADHEIKAERLRKQVPIATLRTAEFLAQQNDPARFKAWLARHSHEDREAIREHLRNKRGPSCR